MWMTPVARHFFQALPIAPWRMGVSMNLKENAETPRTSARLCEHEPPRCGARGVDGREQQDDGVVPQVHAVRALADPHQGLGGKDALHDSRVGCGGAVDERGREHAAQDEPAVVGEGRKAVAQCHHQHEPCERRGGKQVACVLRGVRVLA